MTLQSSQQLQLVALLHKRDNKIYSYTLKVWPYYVVMVRSQVFKPKSNWCKLVGEKLHDIKWKNSTIFQTAPNVSLSPVGIKVKRVFKNTRSEV